MIPLDRAILEGRLYTSVTVLKLWQTTDGEAAKMPYQAVTQGDRIIGFRTLELSSEEAGAWEVFIWNQDHLVVTPSGPTPWDVIEAKVQAVRQVSESPQKGWDSQTAPAALRQLVVRRLEPIVNRSLDNTRFSFLISPEVEVLMQLDDNSAISKISEQGRAPEPGIPWSKPLQVAKDLPIIRPQVSYLGPGTWGEQIRSAGRLLEKVSEAVRASESAELAARQNLLERLIANDPYLHPLRTLSNGRTFAQQSDRARLGPILVEGAARSFEREKAELLLSQKETKYSLGRVTLYVGVRVQGADMQWSTLWAELN